MRFWNKILFLFSNFQDFERKISFSSRLMRFLKWFSFSSQFSRFLEIIQSKLGMLDQWNPQKFPGLSGPPGPSESPGPPGPNDDRMAHKCNQCGYTSSRAGHLSAHLNIHSGEKSNKCNQCDYVSFYASALKTHLKVHSGEKSNKCNQCEFSSIQASNLRTHMKTHWRNLKQMQPVWKCMISGREFEDAYEKTQ